MNPNESAFFHLIQDNGGYAEFRQSPDFSVFGAQLTPDENKLKALVEVKQPNEEPRPGQLKVLAGLAAYDVPCFVWRPGRITQVHADGSQTEVSEEALLSLVAR